MATFLGTFFDDIQPTSVKIDDNLISMRIGVYKDVVSYR